MNHIVSRVRRIAFGLVIVLFLLRGWSGGRTTLAITALGGPKPVVNVTYHVDAVLGDDENDGTSPETAWKTLGRISQTQYGPGNRILLRRGQSWIDQTLYIGNSRDALETYLSGFSASAPTSETMTSLRNSNIPELTYGTIEEVASLDLTAGTVPESMVEFGSYGDPNSPDPIVRNVSIHWTTGIYVHDIVAHYYNSSTLCVKLKGVAFWSTI
jgi:hypothetical protein